MIIHVNTKVLTEWFRIAICRLYFTVVMLHNIYCDSYIYLYIRSNKFISDENRKERATLWDLCWSQRILWAEWNTIFNTGKSYVILILWTHYCSLFHLFVRLYWWMLVVKLFLWSVPLFNIFDNSCNSFIKLKTDKT